MNVSCKTFDHIDSKSNIQNILWFYLLYWIPPFKWSILKYIAWFWRSSLCHNHLSCKCKQNKLQGFSFLSKIKFVLCTKKTHCILTRRITTHLELTDFIPNQWILNLIFKPNSFPNFLNQISKLQQRAKQTDH